MSFFPRSTGALLILLCISLFSNPATCQLQSANTGFISAVISEKGLVFVKDFLVEQAIRSLTSLRLPDIEKSVKIPLIGGVHLAASNIILDNIDVSSSTIQPSDTGIQIVASGANANLSLKWNYTYSTWFLIPVEVSDNGSAFVQVEGLEVRLTIRVDNQNGNLALNVTQCVCHMEDIKIILDGTATWLYQGYII
ncbi:putative BPI/LBP family protein [Platanthera zijinensis]|uniref:BPI/LBP family protein n=1 Tax=Platanthera zijinensis TaxID=2320716 RepID=A0AAP0BFF8_9ASPA